MLTRTRERLEQHGITARISAITLPLPPDVSKNSPARAQLIVMSSVIEYVDADQELLRQCARMLAPGAHLLRVLSKSPSPVLAAAAHPQADGAVRPLGIAPPTASI